MIGFFIGCIVIGMILAVVLAPVIMMANKAKLKEMGRLIQEWEQLTPEGRENTRHYLKKQLVTLKGQIVADKKAIEQARDMIELI